jgi:GrpB-like predicted nucleotidyltransferase (UPF0157 family)
MPDRARDTELDRVLIGGREPVSIVMADYDAGWPGRFAVHRERVRRALGPAALMIEHIGSTAVPGLAAKPIIDVLVAVADADDESHVAPALRAAGYELRVREPGHRLFRPPDRGAHIHVWSLGDPEVARHLEFRDRLRDSPEDRRAYEALKRELARREWADMNHYADAKSPLIARILARGRG